MCCFSRWVLVGDRSVQHEGEILQQYGGRYATIAEYEAAHGVCPLPCCRVCAVGPAAVLPASALNPCTLRTRQRMRGIVLHANSACTAAVSLACALQMQC